MIEIAMPPTSNPYSIAVAPLSSRPNRRVLANKIGSTITGPAAARLVRRGDFHFLGRTRQSASAIPLPLAGPPYANKDTAGASTRPTATAMIAAGRIRMPCDARCIAELASEAAVREMSTERARGLYHVAPGPPNGRIGIRIVRRAPRRLSIWLWAVVLRRSSARATWGRRLECVPVHMSPASSDRLTFSYSPPSSAPAARSEMSLTNSRALFRSPGSEMR